MQVILDCRDDLRIRIPFPFRAFHAVREKITKIIRNALLRIDHIACVLTKNLIEVVRIFRSIVFVCAVDRYQCGCGAVEESVPFLFKVLCCYKSSKALDRLTIYYKCRIRVVLMKTICSISGIV